MNYVVLTQYTGKICGPIAKYILGPIFNGIFNLLSLIHIPNIGLAIILFTIVIYLLLLPLTIKQQKFSKLQAKMQPEIQAIQNKYKNKKDQESQLAMNQETQAVYAKYGVSPTGSCVQLLIQMPILFTLYRVIYSIPAYVPKVKATFTALVSALMNKPNAAEVLQKLSSAGMYSKQFTSDAFLAGNTEVISNTYIDVLNRASSVDWNTLSESFGDIGSLINSTMTQLNSYNNFLGINIGYSPSDTIKTAFASHSYLLIIGAILIPVLSAVTQWINVKLTPQAATPDKNDNSQAGQMASSMKAMNTFMPIFSAIMCFTLPAGMGVYWIAGSVVRSIEQVLINKYIDRMDLDAEIKKNVEKRNAKLRKAGIDPDKVMQNAYRSTKSVPSAGTTSSKSIASKATMLNGQPVSNDEKVKDSTDYYNKKSAKPGSIAAKANMVKQYNEKNNK